MNEVEKRFKEKMTVTVKVTVPKLFWDEWSEDCRENFGNAYWLKMKHDHEYHKSFKDISELIVAELDRQAKEITRLEETFLEELTSSITEGKKSSENQREGPQTRKTMGWKGK